MLSKARIKWIKSLEQRKHRQENMAFVAEGPKLVGELLPFMTPLYLAATEEWAAAHPEAMRQAREADVVSRAELERASLLRTPQTVLAVLPLPERQLDVNALHGCLSLALDGVQDPGNLGTILRIADWFGIRHVICSEGTVDAYNPKCVQSSMGALARVGVYQVGSLVEFLRYAQAQADLRQTGIPVYGTFLDGNNIYDEEITPNGIIVMGNEGNGISDDVRQLITHRLYIPNYPLGSQTTESLNVAVATAIVCAEFRRRF